MKLADRPRVDILYKVDNLVIPLQKGQHREAIEMIDRLGIVNQDKEYEVTIKTKRKKRSLDANAYFWTLCGKLGEALKKPDTEIYVELIKDNGVFEILPVREDAIARWTQTWSSHGIGWVCDDLGGCRNIKGYHNIRCFYGSSTYTTKEMSRLIDAVIYECKQQGIETMTPNEIEEIKQKWGTE